MTMKMNFYISEMSENNQSFQSWYACLDSLSINIMKPKTKTNVAEKII